MFKHIIFVTDDFSFEDVDEIGLLSNYKTGISEKTMFFTPEIHNTEPKIEDAKYFIFQDKSAVKVEDNLLNYRFKFKLDFDWYKKFKSFENTGLRIMFVDYMNQVYTILEDDVYMGLKTSMISVSKPEIGSEVCIFNVDINLSKENDMTATVVTGVDLSFYDLQLRKPIISTKDITVISDSILQSGGVIKDNGNSAITETGLLYSMSNPPLYGSSSKVLYTGTDLDFTKQITGLAENTNYYIRAFAKNSIGVNYGIVKIGTTSVIIPTAPEVTTKDVTPISQTIISCGGTITNTGNSTITGRGILVSTNTPPTHENSTVISEATNINNYTLQATDLEVETTYYIRAFATNAIGTSYGSIKEYYNTDIHVTITTDTMTGGDLQFTVTGSVDCGEGITVIEQGFIYSKTDITPTEGEGGVKVTSEDMSETVTGLDANTRYYARTFVNTNYGLFYGTTKNDYTDIHVEYERNLYYDYATYIKTRGNYMTTSQDDEKLKLEASQDGGGFPSYLLLQGNEPVDTNFSVGKDYRLTFINSYDTITAGVSIVISSLTTGYQALYAQFPSTAGNVVINFTATHAVPYISIEIPYSTGNVIHIEGYKLERLS
jgi:hypothetical protein